MNVTLSTVTPATRSTVIAATQPTVVPATQPTVVVGGTVVPGVVLVTLTGQVGHSDSSLTTSTNRFRIRRARIGSWLVIAATVTPAASPVAGVQAEPSPALSARTQ